MKPFTTLPMFSDQRLLKIKINFNYSKRPNMTHNEIMQKHFENEDKILLFPPT